MTKPKENGETTEIDLLYITVKGILVIESKNYSGYIFGNENSPKWTATLYAGKDWAGRKQVEKNSFYNPIWQNDTHIKYLQAGFVEEIPFFSIIVLSDRCSFKSLSINRTDVAVCHRGQLSIVIKDIWKNNPDVLEEREVNEIFLSLQPYTNPEDAVKQQHVEQLREKIYSTTVCPCCGGKLVVRVAKNGARAGRSFYGCSNYPRCKYTRDID